MMRAVTVPVPPLFVFSNFVTKNIRFFLIIVVYEGEMASYCFTKHGKSGFTSVLVGFFHTTLLATVNLLQLIVLTFLLPGL